MYRDYKCLWSLHVSKLSNSDLLPYSLQDFRTENLYLNCSGERGTSAFPIPCFHLLMGQCKYDLELYKNFPNCKCIYLCALPAARQKQNFEEKKVWFPAVNENSPLMILWLLLFILSKVVFFHINAWPLPDEMSFNELD